MNSTISIWTATLQWKPKNCSKISSLRALPTRENKNLLWSNRPSNKRPSSPFPNPNRKKPSSKKKKSSKQSPSSKRAKSLKKSPTNHKNHTQSRSNKKSNHKNSNEKPSSSKAFSPWMLNSKRNGKTPSKTNAKASSTKNNNTSFPKQSASSWPPMTSLSKNSSNFSPREKDQKRFPKNERSFRSFRLLFPTAHPKAVTSTLNVILTVLIERENGPKRKSINSSLLSKNMAGSGPWLAKNSKDPLTTVTISSGNSVMKTLKKESRAFGNSHKLLSCSN